MEFEIFKPGTYPQGDWPLEKVQQMVDDYDVDFLQAPVTIDHISWGPAFGAVKSLRMDEGGVVVADLDLHPDLIKMYAEKKYVTRSIEPYDPLMETGRPYLGGVTFLGADNPQVKGLKNPQFRETEKGRRVFLDYQDKEQTTESTNKGGARMSKKEALKKWFSGIIDTAEEPDLGETPAAAATVQNTAEFRMSPEDKQKFAEFEAKNKQLADELAAERASKRAAEVHTFCESLKAEGKLLPAWQDAGIEKFMLALDGLEGKQQFSEKAEAEQTPLEFFKGLLTGMSKFVEFKEVAPAGGDAPGSSDEHEFMEVSRQYAEEHKCSMSDAMRHVVTKQPDLHAAFLASCENK